MSQTDAIPADNGTTATVTPPSFVIEQIDASRIDDAIDMFHKYVQFYKYDHPVEDLKKFLLRRLESGSKIFLAYLTRDDDDATGDGNAPRKVIGFTQVYPIWSSAALEENYLLNDLFIDAEYRSLHVGRSLIKHVLAFGDAAGAYSMEIATKVNNKPAQHLYPKMGFKEYARFRDSIKFVYKYERAANKHYPTYYE